MVYLAEPGHLLLGIVSRPVHSFPGTESCSHGKTTFLPGSWSDRKSLKALSG
jgi:hypothetical protein